jgi:exonuclease SbcC
MHVSQLLGDRLLREYRTEKETLLREMAFLTKIAELEDHRAKLEDGKPCPLCGATEHPFAEGNVPVPDETEKKIDALTRTDQQSRGSGSRHQETRRS